MNDLVDATNFGFPRPCRLFFSTAFLTLVHHQIYLDAIHSNFAVPKMTLKKSRFEERRRRLLVLATTTTVIVVAASVLSCEAFVAPPPPSSFARSSKAGSLLSPFAPAAATGHHHPHHRHLYLIPNVRVKSSSSNKRWMMTGPTVKSPSSPSLSSKSIELPRPNSLERNQISSLYSGSYSGSTSGLFLHQQHEQQAQDLPNSPKSDGINGVMKIIRLMIRSYFSSIRMQQRALTGKIKHLMQNRRRFFRRALTAAVLFLFLNFGLVPPDSSWAAGSSGRMGGSTGRSSSSRPSMHHSRPYSASSSPYYGSQKIRNYGHSRPPPIRVLPYLPRHYHHHHFHGQQQQRQQEETTTVTNRDGTTTTVVRKQQRKNGLDISEVVFLVGVASVVAYKVGTAGGSDSDGFYSDFDSPLGPGASAVSLTICLLVPDRRHGTSLSLSSLPERNSGQDILSSLEHIAETVDTSSSKGLKDMVEETSVALLRQKDAIVSVDARYKHTNTPVQAERQYRQWSTIQRGKFERETLSNYGGRKKKKMETIAQLEVDQQDAAIAANSKSTVALVQVTVAIEGNSLKKVFDGDQNSNSNIKTRKGLVEALTQLSSDVQVDDCLLSAEVIWSPQEQDDQLTMQDIYSDFPTLYTLLD
jgi:uncharacterized membrane protein